MLGNCLNHRLHGLGGFLSHKGFHQDLLSPWDLYRPPYSVG